MGEALVYSIKIALAVSCTALLLVAVSAILSFITALGSSTVLGEIIGLISVYLPFSAGTVFGTLSASIVAIIAFLIARKIWDLTGATYKMAS